MINFIRTLAAQDGRIVVADEAPGETDHDRRQGGEPRPLCHVPNGRSRGGAQMFAEILTLIAQLRVPPAWYEEPGSDATVVRRVRFGGTQSPEVAPTRAEQPNDFRCQAAWLRSKLFAHRPRPS